MCGVALLNFISCFVTVRQFLTDSICFRRLYESMTPDSTLALETKRTLEEGFRDHVNHLDARITELVRARPRAL